MAQRYVARVRLAKQDDARPRRPAAVRAVARSPDVETQMLPYPDETAAIFVDRSGRRGRYLRRTVYLLLGVVLALLTLLWLSEGLAVFGGSRGG
jgi:hypothetical protein